MNGSAKEVVEAESIKARIAKLTPREKECLRLVAAPMRTPQIAHELNLTPNTVNTYVASAFKKLGVADRDTAARLLVQHEAISEKIRPDFQRIDSDGAVGLSDPRPRLPLPWPTRGRKTNDLSVGQRLVAILIATAILLGAVSIYFAATASLNAVF